MLPIYSMMLIRFCLLSCLAFPFISPSIVDSRRLLLCLFHWSYFKNIFCFTFFSVSCSRDILTCVLTHSFDLFLSPTCSQYPLQSRSSNSSIILSAVFLSVQVSHSCIAILYASTTFVLGFLHVSCDF